MLTLSGQDIGLTYRPLPCGHVLLSPWYQTNDLSANGPTVNGAIQPLYSDASSADGPVVEGVTWLHCAIASLGLQNSTPVPPTSDSINPIGT